VAPRELLSKGAAKVSELSAARHHQQPVPVRVSVAAAQSEDNQATASLARHHLVAQVPESREAEKSADSRALVNLQPLRLLVQAQAKREAEDSPDNLAPINLQPRHQPVQVPVRREVEVDARESKPSAVNLPRSLKAERKLHLSAGRDNRSVERKRERGLPRRGRNQGRRTMDYADLTDF
jgi:hypothetical protein